MTKTSAFDFKKVNELEDRVLEIIKEFNPTLQSLSVIQDGPSKDKSGFYLVFIKQDETSKVSIRTLGMNMTLETLLNAFTSTLTEIGQQIQEHNSRPMGQA